jgi:hypothetical protein
VDDETLKLDFDLGMQSRTVYFDKTRPSGARSLQGHAVAEWIDLPAAGGRGGGRGGGGAAAAAPPAPAPEAAADGGRAGGLRITTTNLMAQYLRQKWRARQRERGGDRVSRHRSVARRRAVAGLEDVRR